MRRFAPVFLFALVLILGGLLQLAPARAVDAKGRGAKAGEIKVIEVQVDSPENPTPGGPSDEKAVWWNDPKIVKALTLTDEQRKKMTAHLTAFRQQAPRSLKPDAFQETLVQGDWKAARNESERLAENAAKSVRLRGALKIYPKEIEDLLSGHPGVSDVAVVGWPDERLGETVCAYVVPDGDEFSMEDLKSYLDEQKVTKYMYPQHLVFLEEFPMTPTGKVRKASLQEDAAKRAKAAKEGGAS